MIGLFVIGIIVIPLFAFMLAAVFDSKRTARVAALFTGAFALQVAGMVMGMVVFAAILKVIFMS
ncbi:MAG: hypothetical protein HYY29_02225 [Chloroflexi bacterium]|nr:hypothetical protein [Chloroflexota bacterium]